MGGDFKTNSPAEPLTSLTEEEAPTAGPEEVQYAAPEDLSGRTVFGSYVIGNPIGEGGMGAVYVATHRELGTKLAVKVLHPQHTSNRSIVRRFVDEARAASAIQHDNIIRVLDAGRLDESRHYIVMEFLEGETVSDRARAQRLGPQEALAIMLQTAAGLEVAHEKGIVHRDLKPGNLFLQERAEGKEPILKILDFGIAKLQRDEMSAERTMTNAVLGTPHYMAPEQARALPDIDGRTDIFALGLITYELLSGRRAYDAKSAGDLIFQMSAVQPKFLTENVPELPSRLAEVVQWAMSLPREERPATVRAFAHALIRATPGGREVAETVAPALLSDYRPDVWEFTLRRTARSRRAIFVLLGAVAVGASLWGAWKAVPGSDVDEVAQTLPEPEASSPAVPTPEERVGARAGEETTTADQVSATLLSVESQPPGASILLDGVLSGTTPGDVKTTIGNAVTIELRAQGYEPHREELEAVQPGMRVRATLKPVPAPPPGAKSRLRSLRRGRTQQGNQGQPSGAKPPSPPDPETLFDTR